MLLVHRKRFVLGTAMTVLFFAVLAIMFFPLFSGENAFRAADRLFNAISKGSSYAIPRLAEQSRQYRGKPVELTLALEDAATAAAAARMLVAAGGQAVATGASLELRIDLGALLSAALVDADAMFRNDGEALRRRYGAPEKRTLYIWWSVLKETYSELKAREAFAEASFVDTVRSRAIEMSYNFYGIEPAPASAHVGMLVFSLLFYVAYTLFWGYSIMFVFDGLGLEMKPTKKTEA
jgi:hypothetical protein